MTDVKIRHGGETTPDEIRIYICHSCKQFIPLPIDDADVVPPYAKDYALHTVEAEHGGPRTTEDADRFSRHQWGRNWNGLPPLGRGHEFSIVSVTKKAWEDTDHGGRDLIVRQLKDAIKDQGGRGFEAEFYAAKDQFKEDALNCWQKHNRTVSCDDFKTDKMRLQPDTNKMRRAEGLPDYQSNLHVCNWCPVASLVESKIRRQKDDLGLY